MLFDAVRGVITRTFKNQSGCRDANAGDTDAQVTFVDLPRDLIATILSEDLLPDPADLAMLRAVSRAMRDEVAETGRTNQELGAKRAADLGCLRALERLQRRGQLPRREYLCQAAAASGFRDSEAVARERRTLGRMHLLGNGFMRTPRDSAVGSCQRLPVVLPDVLDHGEGRAR